MKFFIMTSQIRQVSKTLFRKISAIHLNLRMVKRRIQRRPQIYS